MESWPTPPEGIGDWSALYQEPVALGEQGGLVIVESEEEGSSSYEEFPDKCRRDQTELSPEPASDAGKPAVKKARAETTSSLGKEAAVGSASITTVPLKTMKLAPSKPKKKVFKARTLLANG